MINARSIPPEIRGKMFTCFRLHELRMSQAELAYCAGVTPVTVSKMERGKTVNNNVLLYFMEHGFSINHCIDCKSWEGLNDENSRRIKRHTSAD